MYATFDVIIVNIIFNNVIIYTNLYNNWIMILFTLFDNGNFYNNVVI